MVRVKSQSQMCPRSIGALLLLGILSAAPSLYGQDPDATDTQPAITTDRPAITDSRIVVPNGGLGLENGFTESSSLSQRTFDFPESLIRFGLTANTEFRFTAPDYFTNLNTGSAFGSGWGDLSVGVKQQLVARPTFSCAP